MDDMSDNALLIVFFFNLWKVFYFKRMRKERGASFKRNGRKRQGKVEAHRAENGSTTMKQSCRVS